MYYFCLLSQYPSLCDDHSALQKPEVSQDRISLKKKPNQQPTHKERKTHPGKGELQPLLHWAVQIHRGCSRAPASLRSLLILQKRGKKDRFAVQMLSNTSNQWKKWHNEQTSMWKQFMKK